MKNIFIELILASAFLSANIYAESITIKTDSEPYLIYEPVYIQIFYTGINAISLSPDGGDIQIEIVSNKGKRAYYQPMGRADINYGVPKQEMMINSIIQITSDSKGWVFGEEGQYIVKIIVPRLNLESNEIPIDIKYPQDDLDKEIVKKIKLCNGFDKFTQVEGGDMFTDALQLAGSIAGGNSSYSIIMNELMAKHFSQMSVDRKGNLRPPSLEKMLNYQKNGNKKIFSEARTFMLAGRQLTPKPNKDRESIQSTEHRELKNRLNAFVGKNKQTLQLDNCSEWVNCIKVDNR